jgi:hypothetical protein
MPMAKRLIAAALTNNPSYYRKAMNDVLYYLKRNMIAYRSHRKKAAEKLALSKI